MNILSRDKQIEIIAALTEGMSIRPIERITGVHRDSIMRLGARVGRGCAELRERMMVGLRVNRLELDECAYGCSPEAHADRAGSTPPVSGNPGRQELEPLHAPFSVKLI